jgi:hypothetical protein
MNLLKIVTLNKHGDFQEVLFTSILSYFLTPTFDHGGGTFFLKQIVSNIYPEIVDKENSLSQAEVLSEYDLGAGKVDICIKLQDKIIAIEAKIWDKSARNISSEGIPQLQRYCKSLSEKYSLQNWHLIFLIPNIKSRICLDEFENLKKEGFDKNTTLITWNPSNSEDDISPEIVQVSIAEIIEEFYNGRSRTEVPLHTQWILDSLYEILPDLLEETKETGRFPVRRDLEQLETWQLFKTFLKLAKRSVNPLHTTVGVPFGYRNDKVKLRNNSLYRIRTTQDYYHEVQDKQKFFPTDYVELELWERVYKECQSDIDNWLKQLELPQNILSTDYHINGQRNEKITLLRFHKDTQLSENDVQDFNSILRRGFKTIMKQAEHG